MYDLFIMRIVREFVKRLKSFNSPLVAMAFSYARKEVLAWLRNHKSTAFLKERQNYSCIESKNENVLIEEKLRYSSQMQGWATKL